MAKGEISYKPNLQEVALFYKPSYLWPSKADPILLFSAITAWTDPGVFTPIVPGGAGGILTPFDIYFITAGNISLSGDYEIHLFYGNGNEYYSAADVTRSAIAERDAVLEVHGIVLPPETSISAKLYTGNNDISTLTVKLWYHQYSI